MAKAAACSCLRCVLVCSSPLVRSAFDWSVCMCVCCVFHARSTLCSAWLKPPSFRFPPFVPNGRLVGAQQRCHARARGAASIVDDSAWHFQPAVVSALSHGSHQCDRQFLVVSAALWVNIWPGAHPSDYPCFVRQRSGCFCCIAYVRGRGTYRSEVC